MAEEQKDESASAEAPPKKKLPVLVILGLAQTVATLGFAAMVVMGFKNMNKPTVTNTELTNRAIASVNHDAAEIQWVELAPFMTNTVSKNSLKTSLNVEVSDAQTAALIKARMPAIRARVLNLLSQQDGKSLRRLQDKLLLKDALRETIAQELAKNGAHSGVVRDVYLMDFMVR